jgi:hypothetical protein
MCDQMKPSLVRDLQQYGWLGALAGIAVGTGATGYPDLAAHVELTHTQGLFDA